MVPQFSADLKLVVPLPNNVETPLKLSFAPFENARKQAANMIMISVINFVIVGVIGYLQLCQYLKVLAVQTISHFCLRCHS